MSDFEVKLCASLQGFCGQTPDSYLTGADISDAIDVIPGVPKSEYASEEQLVKQFVLGGFAVRSLEIGSRGDDSLRRRCERSSHVLLGYNLSDMPNMPSLREQFLAGTSGSMRGLKNVGRLYLPQSADCGSEFAAYSLVQGCRRTEMKQEGRMGASVTLQLFGQFATAWMRSNPDGGDNVALSKRLRTDTV